MPSREQMESIEEPVLLMQGNPRQVVTANRKALELFGKPLDGVEAHRGGEVFDCLHSFSEAGCGKDVNCEPCPIRKAIVATFETGEPHSASAELPVRKAGAGKTYVLQVRARKVGELAVVRIDRYAEAD